MPHALRSSGALCHDKLERLQRKREDLARNPARLLDAAARAKASYRVCRRHKMYIDPELTP